MYTGGSVLEFLEFSQFLSNFNDFLYEKWLGQNRQPEREIKIYRRLRKAERVMEVAMAMPVAVAATETEMEEMETEQETFQVVTLCNSWSTDHLLQCWNEENRMWGCSWKWKNYSRPWSCVCEGVHGNEKITADHEVVYIKVSDGKVSHFKSKCTFMM